VVLSASSPDSPRGAEALERLCRTYWYPLYAYIRRQGFGPSDAEDLTQTFFARLLKEHFVASADPVKGRFRSFLLTRLKHFLADEWDRLKAQKRGGDQRVIPLESRTAETSYQLGRRTCSPRTGSSSIAGP
jgi:RNA polymerase sigma-70 factor (ECF subfamily)